MIDKIDDCLDMGVKEKGSQSCYPNFILENLKMTSSFISKEEKGGGGGRGKEKREKKKEGKKEELEGSLFKGEMIYVDLDVLRGKLYCNINR
jgi:hypothetical protein